MERRTARAALDLLATLIGEILEDHVDLALTSPFDPRGAEPLRQAGADIAALASAIAVIGRRSARGPPTG